MRAAEIIAHARSVGMEVVRESDGKPPHSKAYALSTASVTRAT